MNKKISVIMIISLLFSFLIAAEFPSAGQFLPNLTVGDLNQDNLDELASVYSITDQNNHPQYFLYISTMADNTEIPLPEKVSAKLAFADLNEDGNKEIFVGSEFGNVFVYSYTGTLITIINLSTNFKINSLITEDVNSNGNLEIIVTGNTAVSTGKVYVITHSVLNSFTQYCYSTSEYIQPGTAVGNLDTDQRKEITFITTTTNNHVAKLNKLKFSESNTFLFENTTVLSFPTNLSIDQLYFSNIILAKILKEDGSISKNNRIYFSLISYTRNTTTEGVSVSNNNYSYDYSVSATQIWNYSGAYQVDTYYASVMPKFEIICGNIKPANPGLEMIVPLNNQVLDMKTGTALGAFCGTNNGLNPSQVIHATAIIVDQNGSPYIHAFQGNMILVFDSNGIEMTDMRKYYENDIARVILEKDEEDEISVVGDIFNLMHSDEMRIPMPNSYVEWSQSLGNDRNTGCYLQPLPKSIIGTFNLNYDALIEENVLINKNSTLNVAGNAEVRFTKSIYVTNRGILVSTGSELSPITWSGLCQNTTKGFWKGISMVNESYSDLSYNQIKNAGIALNIFDKGKHSIKFNTVENNEIGMGFYNSVVTITNNKFLNNTYGTTCYNNASPIIGLPLTRGTNTFSNNQIGLFADLSLPTLAEGKNNFENNTRYNIFTQNNRTAIKATNNWWGSANVLTIENKFNNKNLVNYSPWSTTPNPVYGSKDATVFQSACEAFYAKDFVTAIDNFKVCVEDTLLTEKLISLNALFNCYQFTDNLSEYEDYLNERVLIDTDVQSQETILANLAGINRIESNFQTALDYYESILENSPTYEDSCYAVIDIGNTYLEAGTGLKGKYADLQPVSVQQHLIKTQKILSTILEGNHYTSTPEVVSNLVLKQNYPNPFNPSTTISFILPNDGQVELNIYNVKGQKVRSFGKEHMIQGLHSVVWNGKNDNSQAVSSGVYFCKLTSGNKTQIKKMIMMK